LQRETISLNKKHGKLIQTPYIRCESTGRGSLPLFPPSLSKLKSHKNSSKIKTPTTSKNKSLRFRKGSIELLLLKNDALAAEAAGQLELAKDLWGQIFLLCPSEQKSYIKAIERIAERTASADILPSFSDVHTQSSGEKHETDVLELPPENHSLNGMIADFGNLSKLASHSYDFEFISIDINGKNTDRRKGKGRYLVELIGKIELSMVIISGGIFTMGSQEAKAISRELPLHTVKVSPFLLSMFSITKSQWREIAKLPKIDIELPLRPCLRGGGSHPVVEVSWYEAHEFCDRLSVKTGRKYRLPTEAEWEYACRAGTTTSFHFGHSINRNIANYNYYSAYTKTMDEFPFANAFGLYSMHGNIWEWCQDYWHGSYEGAPTKSSTSWLNFLNLNEDKNRVLRGGSWRSELSLCRSSFRFFDDAYRRSNDVGFRIVCSI
jgi:formylglycine-generating enzyme required for sulfatase activity